MISLEQVKLLESKVTKTIDHFKKVSEENVVLKSKLDSYQNRIEELEVLVRQFKEEQTSIEDGILSALDRLNQFEDVLEKTLAAPVKVQEQSKKGKDESKKAPAENVTEKTASEAVTENAAAENVVAESPEPVHKSSEEELDIF